MEGLYVALEFALLVVIFSAIVVIGIQLRCFIAVFLAIIGLVIFFIADKKNPIYKWGVLGVVIGFMFARHLEYAYFIAAIFAIHNLLFATVINIPAVLKKKKFMRTRLIEQVVFMVIAAITYFVIRPLF